MVKKLSTMIRTSVIQYRAGFLLAELLESNVRFGIVVFTVREYNETIYRQVIQLRPSEITHKRLVPVMADARENLSH